MPEYTASVSIIVVTVNHSLETVSDPVETQNAVTSVAVVTKKFGFDQCLLTSK